MMDARKSPERKASLIAAMAVATFASFGVFWIRVASDSLKSFPILSENWQIYGVLFGISVFFAPTFLAVMGIYDRLWKNNWISKKSNLNGYWGYFLLNHKKERAFVGSLFVEQNSFGMDVNGRSFSITNHQDGISVETRRQSTIVSQVAHYDESAAKLYMIYRSTLDLDAKQAPGVEDHVGSTILHRRNIMSDSMPTELTGDYVDLDSRQTTGTLLMLRLDKKELASSEDPDMHCRIRDKMLERKEVQEQISKLPSSWFPGRESHS